MAHKVFFLHVPGQSGISILHPAYGDKNRAIADDVEFEAHVLAKMQFEKSRPLLPGNHTDKHEGCWCRTVQFDATNPAHIDVPVTCSGSCDEADLPDDRYFRDAWIALGPDATSVSIDMPTARGVHMDKIRAVRNVALANEDINILRAIEAGDAAVQAAIAVRKQVLRDIPQTFDLTTPNDTPEELKAMWPVELPARE